MVLDALVNKLLVSGSPLVVLCVVVWLFLKYLSADRTVRGHLQREHLEAIRQMHAEHLDARNESRRAMVEMTHAMIQVAEKISMCPVNPVKRWEGESDRDRERRDQERERRDQEREERDRERERRTKT